MENHNSSDPIVMYLIVRESLNMSIGKTAAQCAHASQMLLLKHFKNVDKIASYYKPKPFYIEELVVPQTMLDFSDLFNKWLDTSFRKVVLKADDKEWLKIKQAFPNQHIVVVDAGLTEIPPDSETVIGLYPMYRSTVPKVIKKLQVLK